LCVTGTASLSVTFDDEDAADAVMPSRLP